MKTYEVLREGEWTRDGRLIREGGVQWDETDSIPVMEYIDEWAPPIILGEMWNIRREDNRILVDSDVVTKLITVTVLDHVVEDITDEGVIISSCRIQTGFVSEPGTYPW